MKKNIAVIGGGIAGITAAHYLNKDHDIVLFEKQNRLGGNAFSLPTPEGDEVDIAVAAFGKAGYPHFYALLNELGIKTELCSNTFMSFHNLDTKEGLYLTPTLKAGLRQGFSMLNPRNVKSLYNLFSGLREANKLLRQSRLKGLSLRRAIAMIPQFKGDACLVFVCTLCLLSSMSYEEVLETPAEFFINKLNVHNDVISPKFLYSVRAVSGGTQSYVNALVDPFRKKVVLNACIKTVRRTHDGIEIIMHQGKAHRFDAVVFACNADQALKLIEKPTREEKSILGVWRYKNGRIVVHKDHSSFPSKDLIQAYTFLYRQNGKKTDTSVNGALWFEPNASDDCDYICAQHPNYSIRKDLVLFETFLRTPMFDLDSIKTIPRLRSLNGIQNTYFCGSHFGYGLHEDAVSSALAVAEHFGVKGPVASRKSSTLESLFSLARKLGS